MDILNERKNEIIRRNANLPWPIPISVNKVFIKSLQAAGFKLKEILRKYDIDNSEKYNYVEKFNHSRLRTKQNEAVTAYECASTNESFIAILMNPRFMTGTISEANGEKIARAFEYATKKKLPLVAFCASGGVRIQEGVTGLVQMAKIDAALQKHSEKGLAYISVLLDPTYGGTSASFGMMGDVIIAEKEARIGFGGRKLVENILHEKIEDDFQTAESALGNGGVDVVCDREEIIDAVLHYLRLMKPATSANVIEEPEYDYTKKDSATVWRNHRNDKRTFNISNSLFDDLVYLRGDRIGGEDKSLQCGIGLINGTNVVFIAQDKGQDLGDTIRKNFGMTSPEGYRKAMRVARLAEKLKLPILILIDSPGAHPGYRAEEGNQSIAISECMMSFLKIKTPVITIVAGEGCSGGALALSISDRIAMFSGSMYAVISPESYASIIYNEYTPNSKILSSMKYLATDLYEEKLIDDVLRQGNIKYNNRQIRNYFLSALTEINSMNTKELLKARYDRIRNWDKR